MSLESVRAFFQSKNLDIPIIELEVSTARVTLAAEAHGVEHGRIAKTLAFRLTDGRAILLVASGDARVSHKKFKAELGKGKIMRLDEVVELTGHPVGGVWPFGLAQPLPIYLDESLRKFDEVLPAAGAVQSALRLTPERICWGCDKYCSVEDFGCGNGSDRTQHPMELLGEDWYPHGDCGLEFEDEAVQKSAGISA